MPDETGEEGVSVQIVEGKFSVRFPEFRLISQFSSSCTLK